MTRVQSSEVVCIFTVKVECSANHTVHLRSMFNGLVMIELTNNRKAFNVLYINSKIGVGFLYFGVVESSGEFTNGEREKGTVKSGGETYMNECLRATNNLKKKQEAGEITKQTE